MSNQTEIEFFIVHNICVSNVDQASLIVGSKFTVFALFYFVFEGNSKYKPSGGLIFGGAIERRVFALRA